MLKLNNKCYDKTVAYNPNKQQRKTDIELKQKKLLFDFLPQKSFKMCEK